MTWIHASALNIETKGLLIRGPSRAGKSQLVLALLDAAAEKGLFHSLIGDDRLNIYAQDGYVAASPHPLIAGMIEDRPHGIVQRPYLPTSHIHAVIDLDNKATSAIPAQVALQGPMHIILENIRLPCLTLNSQAPLAEMTAKVFTLLQSLS